MPNPIIIVPGLLGSSLENFYRVEPEPTWSTLQSLATTLAGPDSFALALDRTGQVDAELEVTNRANGLISGAYERLATALRQRRRGPVYVFPYDWRLSMAESGAALGRFVERVQLKMAARYPGWAGPIDFVTHSFGGLVFRAFLARVAQPRTVGQVVFIAVPQRGCLDAAEAMIRGKSTLFGGRKEMRKLARSFPSLYELLPTFAGAALTPDGRELDLFDIHSWQENVTPLGEAGPELNGFDVEQLHLDQARQQRAALRNPTDLLRARDLLTIYAVQPGSTLERLTVRPERGLSRWFDFDVNPMGEGDGIVLPCSAILAGVPTIRLTSAEASLFSETNARLVSLHAFLATLDETQTIVARFLDGQRGARALLPLGLPLDRYVDAPVPER
jgi:hypothetical protein